MKSFEETIKSFVEKHGNKYDYSLINEIKNQTTKIPIICKKHGVFYQTPKEHKRGQGCPKCANENKCGEKNWLRFIEEAEIRFPGHYTFPHIKDEYKNSHSLITVKCNIDGNTFKKIACDFITSKNGGCRVCYKESFCEYFTYDELKDKTSHEIKPFDGTVERRDKITINCPIHGEYQVIVNTLLNGGGKCKGCSPMNTPEIVSYKLEQFKRTNEEKYGNKFTIEFSEFKGFGHPVTMTCNECGYTFKRTPSSHMKGFVNCSKCASKTHGERVTKTNEEFVEQSKKIYGENAFDYSLCDYKKSNQKVTLICNECGRVFEIEANSHLSRGNGCPYHNRNRSNDEVEIYEFIKSVYSGTVEHGNRTVLKDNHELDIYIPDKKMAIEYDGVFWHNENNKPKNYHLNKTTECDGMGIRLIHVFEDEWKTPLKRKIWESMLKNMLGVSETKVFARKCHVKPIDKRLCYDFLDENHLQGKCVSKIRIGLFHDDELVSVMTFGSPRHFIGNKGNHEYELLRFCSKRNVNVVGAASKLFSFFVKTYSPKSIVSYADRRWSVGNLYDKLGFVLYNKSRPNYYYIINNERKNRFNFRKSALVRKYNCPDNMSEHEFCKSRGWYRIYDCGSLCYEWVDGLQNIIE